MFKKIPTTLLLATLRWVIPTLAQNTTGDNSTCAYKRLIDGLDNELVNSTGNVEIPWSEISRPANNPIVTAPWYLSVYVNDTRNGSNGWDIETQPWLSVAGDVTEDTSVCVYQFQSINATSTGDQAGQSIGCAGILSDGCASHVREALLNASSGAGAGACGQPWRTDAERQRRSDACGDSFPGDFVTTGPIDLTQDNCTVPDLPGADIPDDYQSFLVGGTTNPYKGTNPAEVNATSAYDLRVNQAIPFAMVANFLLSESSNGGRTSQNKVQLVCVTPNHTLEGSRVPSTTTPWGSSSSPAGSGAESRWHAQGMWALAVAGSVAYLSVL